MLDLNISYVVVLALVVAGVWFWLFKKHNQQLDIPRQVDPASNQLHTLIEGTIGTTGESFFYALARELAHYLQIDSIIVASCEEAGSQSYRTHAYWCDDGYIMNQSISLANSPSGSAGGFWNLENSASDMFPESDLFHNRFRVAGFFSAHLQDSSGNKIGLLAGMHRNSFHPDNQQIDIIKLFCARAAARTRAKPCNQRDIAGKRQSTNYSTFHRRRCHYYR